MIANLSAAKTYYVDHFPNEVPNRMAQGFVASAAFHLIAGSTLHLSLTLGALAATATLVEAAVRPIFCAYLPERLAKAVLLFIFSELSAVIHVLSLEKAINLSHINVIAQSIYLFADIAFYLLSWFCLDLSQFDERNSGMTCIF